MFEWLQTNLGLSAIAVERLTASFAVVVILWTFRRVAQSLIWRQVEDVGARYRWQKTLSYTVVPIGILVIGRIWFEGIGSIATFLGLLSAGIAIALRDPLVNLAGWAFILWRRPFEVGDRIEMGDAAGDVIDIRIFQFTLLEIGNWVQADQSTGRIIHVPNGKVFVESLANYSKGFQHIWNELPITLTFESDWAKAKAMLIKIAQDHSEHLSEAAEEQLREVSRKFMIFYGALTPTVYTSVADSGVTLTIRYLCAPRKRRGTAQTIWEQVLTQFAECEDIDFAYPTIRYFDNRAEGKADARAP